MIGGYQIIDGKPVETYYNGSKVAGSKITTTSGAAPLTIDRTYNDYAEYFIMSGNSAQSGIPAPDSPVPIISVGGNLQVYDRSELAKTVSCPFLRKIGSIADTYNPITGEHVQRMGIRTFKNTDDWRAWSTDMTYQPGHKRLYLWDNTASKFLSSNEILCTHLKSVDLTNDVSVRAMTENQIGLRAHDTTATNSYFVVDVPNGLIGVTDASTTTEIINAWKSYLLSNPNISVIFVLQNPITSWLDPVAIPTYYGYTKYDTDSIVKPIMTATVKTFQ